MSLDECVDIGLLVFLSKSIILVFPFLSIVQEISSNQENGL